MKFKASYFSVSGTLVKENLRRFWAIPVIGFLIYFLSGVFPILMSYSHLNDMSSYIEMCLNNKQPFYMIAHLLIPIITAVIIFRYLQHTSSVTAFHAMPFTRMKLYNSSLISGLIMILTPIIANGLLLLCIAKPAYQMWTYDADLMSLSTDVSGLIDVFARADILTWMGESIVIVLVIYAISVFAGMVTGNSVMHLAMAFGFNFLVPALYGVFILYCNYLYGFDYSGNWSETMLGSSPYLQVFTHGGEFAIGLIIYYLLNALVLFILSAVLYQKRKLEKASDAFVFKFMVPIISYLVAFFGMSLFGFYFSVLGGGEPYFYAGLIAGAVVFFVLGRMIVLKTPRIFNAKSVKSFAVYAVIAAVFVTSIMCDLTGFEDRIPNADKVKGAAGGKFVGEESGTRYYSELYLGGSGMHLIQSFTYTSEENITALVQLHQDILKNRAAFEVYNGRMSYLKFSYDTGSLLPMQRAYSVPTTFLVSNAQCKQLFEGKEFKQYYSLNNLNYTRMISINFNDPLTASNTITVSNQNELKELMACMEQDFQERTYEQQVDVTHMYANATLNYKMKDERGKTKDSNMYMEIKQSDKNTLKWLEEHGYSEQFLLTADQVESITVYKYDYQEQQNESYDMATMDQKAATIAESNVKYGIEEEGFTITDPEQIQLILDNYMQNATDYNHYYYAYANLKPGVFADGRDGGYQSDETMYFNDDNLPDFLKSVF